MESYVDQIANKMGTFGSDEGNEQIHLLKLVKDNIFYPNVLFNQEVKNCLHYRLLLIWQIINDYLKGISKICFQWYLLGNI